MSVPSALPGDIADEYFAAMKAALEVGAGRMHTKGCSANIAADKCFCQDIRRRLDANVRRDKAMNVKTSNWRNTD